MNKAVNILLVIVLFAMLAAVRYFQEALFYDPLIPFFKSNSVGASLPELQVPKFYIHLTFRFVVNTLLSLSVLWFLFQKWEIVKLSMVIYTLLFVLLIVAMVLILTFSESTDHQLLFYVRRFLIQPLFLLLLIPAYYFVKR